MINTRKNSIPYKILAFIGKRMILSIEFFISKFVKPGVIFPDTDFEWIKEIEGHCPEILEEYQNLLKEKRLTDISEKVEEQQIVVEKDKWLFFPLYAYGYPIHKNIQLCPKTDQAVKKIPHYSGVFFSTIVPGTYIKPHRGLYKGYLRFHLGLIVPEEFEPNKTCRLRLLNTEYKWENGKGVVFDDTYMHDAWNYTDKTRGVLVVDFIRPMPRVLVLISKGLILLLQQTPFIKNAVKNLNEGKPQDIKRMVG